MSKNYDEYIEEDEDLIEAKPRKKGGCFIVLAVVVLILGLATALAMFLISSATDILAFGKSDNSIEITIEEGSGLNEIAKVLGEAGVIEQPLTFTTYAKFRKRDSGFQAGEYMFNTNMSYDRILSALRQGDTVREEVKITFREGLSLREIANILEENRVCSASEFIAVLEPENFSYEFLDMIPENELRFRSLEGYIFPDTYDFFVGENVSSVARKFLRNFQNRVFPDLYGEITNAGMTLDEAVTLASIIQKEAGDKDEMLIVSSVFHNRIDDVAAGLPMLQSDVTIFYVEKDIKPFQTMATQDIYDAYNTYVKRGLPVGPICSPGLDAIRAAVNPAKTDYYFFVTDVNGVYYYGKTANEHYANVRTAAAAGGTQTGTNVQ